LFLEALIDNLLFDCSKIPTDEKGPVESIAKNCNVLSLLLEKLIKYI